MGCGHRGHRKLVWSRWHRQPWRWSLGLGPNRFVRCGYYPRFHTITCYDFRFDILFDGSLYGWFITLNHSFIWDSLCFFFLVDVSDLWWICEKMGDVVYGKACLSGMRCSAVMTIFAHVCPMTSLFLPTVLGTHGTDATDVQVSRCPSPLTLLRPCLVLRPRRW